MRHTDYEALAAQYDAPWRTDIPPDSILLDRLAVSSHIPYRVLDVACGTGAWLLSQSTAYAGTPARFHGIESTAAMLAIAQGKGVRAELKRAAAEQIPYPDGLFDFIITRHAYHHFQNKDRAFDEVIRVLRPGGVFVLFDMAPEKMPDWLVYQFFPEAYVYDLERFVPLEQLTQAFEKRGCTVKVDICRAEKKVDMGYVLGYCQGRGGTSSLQILSEQEFEAGLHRIHSALATDPGRVVIDGDCGFTLVANKPS